MTQTVSVPSCEDNLGRNIKNFLYVEGPKKDQLQKRYYQSKLNFSFKETEKDLDKDLLDYFKESALKLIDIKIYHSSHLLSKDLRIANFRSHANGLSFLVFTFEGHPPLFTFTICSKKDNFSRLEGRVYVKRKALHTILKHGVEGLYGYPTPTEYVDSINPLKIGNWIVKNYIIPEKEKTPIVVNKLKYENEDKLLAMAKELISQKYDIDIATIKLHTQYIRFYKTNLFSNGLVCTPSWFTTLKQEGKELLSNGGYTIYAMVGQKKESETKEVFVTLSRCSLEENYVKSYGRKQCLINFIKDQQEIYSLSQPVENMNDALLTLAEKALQHAINVEIVSEKESSLVPKQ